MPAGGRAPKQIVKQSTIDEMKRLGMAKALERANSGTASAEYVEGAKRMYGNRVKPAGPSQNVVKPTGHIIEEVVAKPTLSKKASKKYGSAST